VSLSESDKKTLQEIVDTNGKCLSAKRCQVCPFRAKCLPEFLNPSVPTESQRLEMAITVLTHHALLEDDLSVESINEDYDWKQKK
jgi:hypothetical protein